MAQTNRAKMSDLVEDLSRGLKGRRIVIVDPGNELPLAIEGLSGASITIARFAAINRTFIEMQAPDVILSPLMADDHDILDLAHCLAEAGYSGALRAYSSPLPRPDMVRTEVKQIWPGGDFDLLDVPHPPAETPQPKA